MTARLSIIILWALALSATAAFAQAPAPVGQIVALQGSATAVGAGGASRALTLKAPIYMNDKITTMAGSRLQIMFTDNSVVSQGEKSSMTIDEYVFTPSKQTENACSLNLAQGVFRVVTDRITKLNPDRFKVKTKMATIGIRGCDLGFNLRPGEERVYTFTLQGTEQVIVTRTMSDSERQRLQTGLSGILNLLGLSGTDSGTIQMNDSREMVVLSPDQPARVVEIPWTELRDTLQGVQVQPGSAENQSTTAIPATDGRANPSETASGTFLAWLTTFVRDPNATPPNQPDPPPQQAPQAPSDNGQNGSQNGSNNSDNTPTGPTTTFVTQGTGKDWSWGVWMVNGLPDSVEFKSPSTLIDSTDPANPFSFYDTIAQGTQRYDLSGTGDTAAMIAHDGVRELVMGNCTLNVQVGGGVTPNWDGVFFKSTDPLYFEASGTILKSGQFTGDPVVYRLSVPGHSPITDPTSLTAHDISGSLVGSATATPPITGAIGTYTFSHGTAIQVKGGFGADLHVPMP